VTSRRPPRAVVTRRRRRPSSVSFPAVPLLPYLLARRPIVFITLYNSIVALSSPSSLARRRPSMCPSPAAFCRRSPNVQSQWATRSVLY
jgi:hypothetical protein